MEENLKKIKLLIRYELTNLKRSPLIWIILILYIFAVEQDISSMNLGGRFWLTSFGFIELSWFPLNMIMIPILLVNSNISSTSNDIFETMDLSYFQKKMGKILSLVIFNGVILIINLIVFIVIAAICKVSFGYFLYEFLGYFLNNFIFFFACIAIGLFVGEIICKYLSEMVGFIAVIILFLLVCNFYKEYNNIIPLIGLKMLSYSFDVITYDKEYFYHNVLWIIISFALIFTPYIIKNIKKVKVIIPAVAACFCLFIVGIYLSYNVFLYSTKFYDITIKEKVQYTDDLDNMVTYYAKQDCGYHVDKYDMNMSIGDKIKNHCEMDVIIDKNPTKTLEFGLYEYLKISKVEVDGLAVEFQRTNHSFKVKLSKNYNEGEIVKVNLQYEGRINTNWWNGEEFFHARSNSIFLADVFEWYPKLNDGKINKYNVNLQYDGKYKIYSNIHSENKDNQYKLTGEDKELFLISNRMIERKYKGYIMVGNEEFVKDDRNCDETIAEINSDGGVKPSKIIFGLTIPGKNEIQSYDNKVILCGAR